jgi:predicted RNA-binding Zn ribbon-like protein
MTTPSRRGRPRDPVMSPGSGLGFVPALFLADDPALDLLNTEMLVDGEATDVLSSDGRVLEWLDEAGLAEDNEYPSMRDGDLLRLAVKLRKNVRTLVDQKRNGEPLDIELLNEFLVDGRQQTLLAEDFGGGIRLDRTFERTNARDLLVPLALAAAELLVNGDFSLVRKCESDDCILYFYDRTKSHRRRWCSAATCGNRDKVARFRERLRTRR